MSISSSSSSPGSSSTTTAMFFISRRKRAGMSSIASATSFSNWFLVTSGADLVGSARDYQTVVVAVVTDGTLIAERLRLADAPAMQDLHVRGKRPHLLRQEAAQLLFDFDGIVAFRDPDAVRDAQHVTINGQAGHAERVAEDDMRGLASDAGQRGELLHVRRHLAAMLRHELLRHPDQRLRFLTEEARGQDDGLELGGRRPG